MYPKSAVSREEGVITLVVSLMILLAMTLMTFSAAKVTLTEQRIAANDYRAKQAFEAAQSGLESAMTFLANKANREGLVDIVNNTTGNAPPDGLLDVGAGRNQIENALPGNAGSYTVTFSSPSLTPPGTLPAGTVPGSPETFSMISLTSSGFAFGEEASATRTVSQTITIAPAAPVPGAPLISRLKALVVGLLGSKIRDMDGDAEINRTIWSGEETTVCCENLVGTLLDLLLGPLGDLLGNSGLNALLNNLIFAPPTETADGSTGIQENDRAGLSADRDEFFEQFFEADRETIRAMAEHNGGLFVSNNPLVGVDLALLGNRDLDGKTIWVDGKLTAASVTALTQIGSPDNPVRLILDGSNNSLVDINISALAQANVYGMVYVVGNSVMAGVDIKNALNLGGRTDGTITGAFITEGNATFAGIGANINFDKDVLRRAAGQGGEIAVPVPGTWSDFIL